MKKIMLLLDVCLFCLLGLNGCADFQRQLQQPQPGAGPGTYPAQSAAVGPPAPELKGAITVSVSVKNQCPNTVHVFYGKEPKYGSGTEVALGGNSLQNQTFRPGDMIWVVDDQHNGVASTSVSEGTHDVTVGCSNISSH